jgi:hypothetical protein
MIAEPIISLNGENGFIRRDPHQGGKLDPNIFLLCNGRLELSVPSLSSDPCKI